MHIHSRHTEFDLETERANANKVADAIKADGWKFASHTWGHMKVGEASIERIQADTQKWKENVEPLVGPTDTIIFAHGQDLAEWTTGYTPDNAKFNYLKEQGFHYFCNVDSKQYSVQIKDNYFRQGRRNLDGYRIYYNSIGEMDSVSDLFNASDVTRLLPRYLPRTYHPLQPNQTALPAVLLLLWCLQCWRFPKYKELVGEDDKFGEDTWEEAESTLQKEAASMAIGKRVFDWHIPGENETASPHWQNGLM
mgnify:CR=1 FL=1